MPRIPLLPLVALLVSLGSCGIAAAAPARIDRPGAELRAEPGFAAPVIARPAAGSDVDLVEAQGAWRRVRLADGAEGWMHELFVKPIPGGEIVVAPGAPSVAPPPDPAAMRGAPDAAQHAAWDAERGEFRSEIAQLRGDLMAMTARAELAEKAAGSLDARVRELERAASAATSEVIAREACRDATRDAVRDAEMRCAQDTARQIEAAVAQALSLAPQAKEPANPPPSRPEDLAELASCREAHAAASAENARLTAALESEKAAHAAALATAEAARVAGDAARVAALEALEREHLTLHDTYIEIVTQRHEDALARERTACAADCDALLLEERRRHDREIRAARKESGWDVEFEKELRARTKLAIEEAEARWEAKRRGEAYDEQRVRRDEEARVRRLCDAERFTAVQAALTEQAREASSRHRREIEESDLRCQVALEVVLERAASGADLADVREFARERTRPVESPEEAVAQPANPEPEPAQP